MFVTILPEENRQGTFQSGSIGGQIIPASATRLTIRALMSNAVRANAALSLSFHVYKSFDAGQTWQHDTGGTWRGGTGFTDRQGVVNPPISITYEGAPLESIKSGLVRLEIDIPVEMRVGAEAEVL